MYSAAGWPVAASASDVIAEGASVAKNPVAQPWPGILSAMAST